MSPEPETSPLPLLGVTVLITGAASEGGRETARALSVMGANLHLADTNETELIEATLTFHENAKGGIKLHVADIAEHVDTEVLAMDCEDATVIVHLAGIYPDTENTDDVESKEQLSRAWDRRVIAADRLARELAGGFDDEANLFLLLPFVPESGGVQAKMANAALETLAKEHAGEATGLKIQACPFYAPDALVGLILEWVLKQKA